MKNLNPAVFIDKDGTLVDNSKYPKIPTDDLLDNLIDGLKYIKERGYKLIIISNQPWIAKGEATFEEVDSVFKALVLKLRQEGVEIDDYFFCPHQSSDECQCKKPKHKLIFDAAVKHQISIQNSFMIGDMDADIGLGKNAGLKTILVKTGRGSDFLNAGADFVIENINQVREII